MSSCEARGSAFNNKQGETGLPDYINIHKLTSCFPLDSRISLDKIPRLFISKSFRIVPAPPPTSVKLENKTMFPQILFSSVFSVPFDQYEF